MNENNETGNALNCSFCKDKLCDVVKMIPDCGNSICGRCYENLKEDADKKTNEYKCVACGERHTLPLKGLYDNKSTMVAIREIKKSERLMDPNIKKLREVVKKVEDKMEMLRTFDGEELIKSYCERIERKASEAIEKAIEHLEETEKKIMRQINEYRDRCLENLSRKSTEYRERCIQNLSMKSQENEHTTEEELTELEKKVSEFNARWNDFLTRRDAKEFQDDIAAALDKTQEYMSALESVEVRMKKDALNWEEIVFKVNSQFLQEWNHVGEIEIIAEPSVNSAQPKKMTIQETPLFTLTGHSDYVRQVLFLPNNRLASCSDDKTIKIWNIQKGEELFELEGHKESVFSMALLPNGNLASGSADKTIKIWNLEQRNKIRSIKAHSKTVASLRVLKSGNLASFSSDDTIKIWNLNSNENDPVSIMRGHGNTCFRVQLFGILSNDYLVTCSRHRENNKECILRVWNPNKPNSSTKSVRTGLNYVRSLLVLSNYQVALGCEKSGTIKIIDLDNEAPPRTIKKAHEEWVSSLSQLSNGNLISAGLDASKWNIKVWNLLDLRPLQTINSGHSDLIWSLSISSDEKFLGSGSVVKTIKLWPISIE